MLSRSEFWHNPLTWRYLRHNLLILTIPTQFQLPGVLADARWPAVNVPIWTLKYELICYLLLLAVYKGVPRRPGTVRLVMTAAAVLGLGFFLATRLYPSPNMPGLESLGAIYTVHLARFLMVFFAGALYAAAEPQGERTRLLLWMVPASLVCFGPTPEFGRAGIVLTLALLAIEVGRSPYLFSRTYRRIGDLSYGTYLYAFPIQLLSLTRWLTPSNFWALTLLDVILILACAALSWHLVERPALQLKRFWRGVDTSATRDKAQWPTVIRNGDKSMTQGAMEGKGGQDAEHGKNG